MEKIKYDLDLDDDIQKLLQDDVETKLKELSQKKINRKKRNRKIRRLILLVIAALFGIYLLSDASKVKSLSAQGSDFYSDKEIYEKAGISYESRYLLLPSFYMEWKLKRDPFIRDATVTKQMDGVILIEIADEEIFGYIVKENETVAVLKDGTQREIAGENLMSIANYALIGNFTEEQLHRILSVFYNESNPVKEDIIAMISEIQPHATSYDENMVRIIMRDGNVLYGSYSSIRLLNYYKQTLASLKTHPTCLSLDEATSSIVSLKECPAN